MDLDKTIHKDFACIKLYTQIPLENLFNFTLYQNNTLDLTLISPGGGG